MVGSAKDWIVVGGISIYWPMWLVCAGGLLLVLIAVFALLMVRGKTENSPDGKQSRAKPEKQQRSPDSQVEIRFHRIRWEGHVTTAHLAPGLWWTVGSGQTADFCLAQEDSGLEKIHFRIFINGSALLVTAAEGEIFVNGVPTRNLGAVAAYSGDLIRAGSYEYRVIFASGEEKERAK